MFALLLALANFAAASLEIRQTATTAVTPVTNGDIIPLLQCDSSHQPVTNCGITYLTQANWAALNIDRYLIDFLTTFGSAESFPAFFVNQQATFGGNSVFDCRTMDSSCIHPTIFNPAVATDCTFTIIPNIQEQVCNRYLSPQAGFVVQNWINLWQGVENSFRAIEDAGNSITSSNFINDIVDGLSDEKGSLLDAVFEALASTFIMLFIPLGNAGTKLFEGLNSILGESQDNLGGPLDIIKVVQANEAINDLAERTKDQLTRQVQEIVVGTQGRMQRTLDTVFGSTAGSAAISSADQARISIPFQFASSGQFLNPVPPREELAAQMETNLKHWIISNTIRGMGWELLLDPTAIAEDPSAPAGSVCRANQGLPFVLGQPCALFRKSGFNRIRAANPSTLEQLVSFKEIAENAAECAGGRPDETAITTGNVGAGGLPRCFYSFKITTLD